jgi:hypothetical protein
MWQVQKIHLFKPTRECVLVLYGIILLMAELCLNTPLTNFDYLSVGNKMFVPSVFFWGVGGGGLVVVPPCSNGVISIVGSIQG